MIEQITKIVKENQALLAIFGIAGFGTAIGIFYKVYGWISRAFNHFCFVNISFESIDAINFRKVQYWMFNLKYTKTRCRSFNIRYVRKNDKTNNKNEDDEDQLFYPGYGKHYLFLNRRPAIIYYNKSDSKELAFRETIDISIFCLFNKLKVTQNILKQINTLYDDVEYSNTSIYSCTDAYGSWEELSSKNIKQKPILSTSTEYEELITDIDNFINNEKWYEQRGINYKRGFLFGGPPGNGKTSCILALAQRFKKHICLLNLATPEMTDYKLLSLITNLPSDAFLAFEDIEKLEERPKEGVSLSTVLNILDGVASPNQFIFFMTTNFVEQLNKNLIRPGRVDVFKTFNNANGHQCETLFKRFFPEAKHKQLVKFKNKGLDKSMSYLESHLIKYSNDIEKAAEII